MKSNRIITGLAGVFIFLSIVIASVLFLQRNHVAEKQELTFDDALTRIKNKDIAEVYIKQDSLELISREKEKFFSKLDASDAAREMLLGAIEEVNKEKPGSIKTTLEQSSSGWGGTVLVNFGLPFFIMWGLTLAVIVYAVRSLSRNKG